MKKFIKKNIRYQDSILFLLLIFITSITFFSVPSIVYGWGSEYLSKIKTHVTKDGILSEDTNHADSAHYFIIDKAIEHLRKEGLLSYWPLETYQFYIKYGAFWADFPFSPVGLVCDWAGFYMGTCDALHHYYDGDCIYLTDVGTCIGDGGGLGAPEYAQTLFDLAVSFWPGGTPVPSIYDLPIRDSGGYMTTKFEGADLGWFLVGGHPFAYNIECLANCPGPDLCLCHKDWAYYWPGFVNVSLFDFSPKETVRNSMTYLGWAIHLVEDLSTPVHALNETGTDHAKFEGRADELINNGSMSHLPVPPDGTYSFVEVYNDYPVSPNFFYPNWSITQFAQEAAHRSIDAKTPPWSEGEWGMVLDDQVEIDLDTSSKLIAGVLYKFFSPLELSKDSFEQNDIPAEATIITNGVYEGLTIHAPLDDDFYEITVLDNNSTLRVGVNFDNKKHDLGMYISYLYCDGEYCTEVPVPPRETDGGFLYEGTGLPAGRKYLVHVFSMDSMPANYSLFVTSNIDEDFNEPNDTHDTATEFQWGCNYTGKINIHNDSDVDLYKVDASGYSVKAEITFNHIQGELEMSLENANGNPLAGQISDIILSEDSTKKTLSLIGCGEWESFVRVKGDPEPNFYDICITRVPPHNENCSGYVPLDAIKGIGNFVYTSPSCTPGQPPPVSTAILRDTMYGTISNETPEEVFWTIGGWLDLPESYLPLVVELHCSRAPRQIQLKLT